MPSKKMDLDQEIQERGEPQMQDARTSTSSQRLSRTYDNAIERRESDITTIPVVRPESFPAGSNRNIPVSVQELVYGSKEAGVGTSAKSLDRCNELLSSSEDVHGPRKDRRTSEGLDTHFLQGKSGTDPSLVEKRKHVVRGLEEVGPRKGQQLSGSSPSLKKGQKRTSKPQRAIRRARKRQRERQNTSGTSLTHRINEFPRKRRQPRTMCSIWKEI
ncbi:hypothetical protein O181_072546 [Austropuccinia psidii MF-1]|uniref:Uncharacterized protein n=1 Tax=Austropuccinia psidii MF-1 TaxID=1389203 RepID=A0A9Q3F2W8_9BASI|nr:hypothetical protein [Austropuccinia psidii MF-1]